MLLAIANWFKSHHPTTYMVLIAVCIAGTLSHPSPLSVIALVFLAAWLFLLREFARIEAGGDVTSNIFVFTSGAACGICIVLLFSIKWIAV